MKKYIFLAATLLVAFVASAQIKIQSLPAYNAAADNYYVPIAGPGGVTYKVLGKLLAYSKPDSIRIKNDSLFEYRNGDKTLVGILTSGGVITGTVSTFNGRQGTVVPTAGDYTFAMLGGKPTTLTGYGITDAASATHVHDFASLTSRPTTLSGYGITDASPIGHNHTFSSLLSKPTTLSGYGITDAAPLVHLHTLSNLSQSGATLNQVPKWNGSGWVPADEAGGSGVTNLGITRSASSATISSSTGTSAVIPSVDGTNAGLATPSMLLNLSKAFTLRNATGIAGAQKQLYAPNDSTGIVKAQIIRSSSGELLIDTTASSDSLINVDLSVSTIAQSKVTGLTAALNAKLSLEEATSISTINPSTTKRFVQVNVDATNDNKRTLYYHTGDSLYRIATTPVALPAVATLQRTWQIKPANQFMSTTQWSGWSGLPGSADNSIVAGTTWLLRDNTNSNTSSISFVATDGWASSSGSIGTTPSTNGGIFCLDQLTTHGWITGTATVAFKITGLTAGKYYDIGIYANSENYKGLQQSVAFSSGGSIGSYATGNNYGACGPGDDLDDPAIKWVTNQTTGTGEITITITRTAGTEIVLSGVFVKQWTASH